MHMLCINHHNRFVSFVFWDTSSGDKRLPTGAIHVVVGLGSPSTLQWSLMSCPTRPVTGAGWAIEGGPSNEKRGIVQREKKTDRKTDRKREKEIIQRNKARYENWTIG